MTYRPPTESSINLDETFEQPSLNERQQEFVDRGTQFFQQGNDENEFVLKGPGGTGKTFSAAFLLSRVRGELAWTAPTNKATKVLRNALRGSGSSITCRTIFSLLGLRMEANGEVRELANPEEPVDLSKLAGVVVDEASMEGRQLREHIRAHAMQGIKFLHMGDWAQLSPVGEDLSEVWKLQESVELTEVKRNKGPILELGIRLREQLTKNIPTIRIESDNDGERGVWKLSGVDFQRRIQTLAEAGVLAKPEHTKILAWRNARVDQLNALVRLQIYGPQSYSTKWIVGDRLILTGPAKDFGTSSDDGERKTIAFTDDEGTVERVEVCPHPVYEDFTCWRLTGTLDDNKTVTLWSVHESSQRALELSTAERAEYARLSRRWDEFWLFKEAFHPTRHSYALTNHRAQGSTYQTVLLDASDTLSNRSRHEAFRGLYVGESRPRSQLFVA